jgi:arginyl-tRNA synthetase
METVKNILSLSFSSVIARVFPLVVDSDAMIQPAKQPQFGDYQANFAMVMAKHIGQSPRVVARQVIEQLGVSDVWDKLEIAGPGFINIRLSAAFLQKRLQALLGDERLGVPFATFPQVVVVDYGGVNVAKEMHVGHLRSSIIGDTIARVLDFQGHQVIRQNHVGDWGTQFGMLIEYMLETAQQETVSKQIAELNALYKQAKLKFDANEEFAARARARVVALQGGDEQSMAIWRGLVAISKEHFNDIFFRLGIGLGDEHIRGESFYNDRLADLIQDLKQQALARIDQGAMVIELEGFVDRDGNPLPLLVRKRDGGYLYATTDLAAARFRIESLRADRIVYVTDTRQTQHFAMVFAALDKANWVPTGVRLEHVAFGAMLGEDKKPFKTRSGEMISLSSLLEESRERAARVIRDKNPELTAVEVETLAGDIGVAALKYADLKTDRIKDYVFSWERMIAFEGNTAPYLLNAYVRILSIFRKGGHDPKKEANTGARIKITETRERELAIRLLEFPDVIEMLGKELLPHRLCNYLYELASTYHRFYEACPVLSAETTELRDSRLALSELTARSLKCGLELFGINMVEKM